MTRTQDDVVGFMSSMAHPRKSEIEELRAAILASNPEITERVKWNAPSFGIRGDDRVTFRLQPGSRLELIFHRGAKVRSDSDTFEFEDPTGLVRWASADRGVVTVADSRDLNAKKDDIVRLVNLWIHSTDD